MAFSWEFSNTPAGRVLRAIQVRGRASIKDVACDLGVTPSAVRSHLTQLQARGAVQAERVREGVGRPHYVYSLAPGAHDLFYKDYGVLARLLLEDVKETQGVDALQELLERVADRLAALYGAQVKGQGLAQRVRAWVDLLDERGVPAEFESAEGGFVLREYGCLYRDLAVESRAVCEMEQQVMARLLGAEVELRHCAFDGHHGCEFVILAAAKDRSLGQDKYDEKELKGG